MREVKIVILSDGVILIGNVNQDQDAGVALISDFYEVNNKELMPYLYDVRGSNDLEMPIDSIMGITDPNEEMLEKYHSKSDGMELLLG